MDIGIGLPNAVRDVDRRGIVDWAKRAEQAGFASLGTIDRITYPNYESLIALAAAAAVTERVRLTTDILIAPLRSNTALFAKQAATIDALSGGRLVLGLAVGGRPDDYDASHIDFHARGKVFDRQLAELNELWAGDVVGPQPAQSPRPTLLIGGSSDVAFRRAAEHADGWTMGGGTPDMFAESLSKLRDAWSAAGRDGQPRTSALFYFSLGPDAADTAQRNIGDYYSFLGDYADQVVQSAAKDADTLKGYISAFEQAGADEVICFPASSDPAQVELLAEAAGL
ncbi:MAG TPA: LLM class flavin-dependent oxidoreductase [Solirubrobacteraceae bacterium]|jgi:alkanesulfonate monooxygenase SsuD/methylene tetrahydromethanopterin reductase-like flavin-dependent oxidoreductase (luciferase family)